MSDLLKSKKASFTLAWNSWSRPALAAGPGASSGPPLTVILAEADAGPPGPLAGMVEVVDCVGVTGTDPSVATLPIPGAKLKSVASVDVQLSVTLSPGLIWTVDAFKVTLGCGAEGGAASSPCRDDGTFFLHPPTSATIPSAQIRTAYL